MTNALLHFTLAAGRFSYHRNTTDTPEQVDTPDTTGLKKFRKIHDSAKKHYISHDDTSKIRFGNRSDKIRQFPPKFRYSFLVLRWFLSPTFLQDNIYHRCSHKSRGILKTILYPDNHYTSKQILRR